MKKRWTIAMGAVLISMMVFNAGCALLNTALAAGAAYGIYQATGK